MALLSDGTAPFKMSGQSQKLNPPPNKLRKVASNNSPNDIVTRLETTQLTSIALSVLTANLFKMQRRILCAFLQFLENCKRDSDLKIHLLNFVGSRKEFSICT